MAKNKKRKNKKASDLSLVGAALKKADENLKKNQYQHMLDCLLPFENEYPFADEIISSKYNRLLAFGYALTKQIKNAEDIIALAKDNSDSMLDFLFLETFIAKTLKENDRVVDLGAAFLNEFDFVTANGQSIAYSFSAEYLAKVHNMIGLAYFELGQFKDSEKYLNLSIKINPDKYSPYLSLARLYRATDRYDSADAIILKGIEKSQQIQELRMLANYNKKQSTISACMIVKDEAKNLPRCLDSIRDWVDEIIIVDTGSTDQTVAIAQSYGAKIFNQKWENDFSKHRNYSIEQATGDWIFIIDADEQVTAGDVPKLLEVVNSGTANLISVDIYNICDDDGLRTTFLHSNRMFRRELNLRYEGIVHNLLVVPDDQPILRTSIRINHYGYNLSDDDLIKKISRSKPLIEKQIADDPGNAFARYNLSQILLAEGRNNPKRFAPRIIGNSKKTVELTNPEKKGERHIHLMALFQLAVAHSHLKKYEPALKYCHTALELKPDFLDPLLLSGQIYSHQNLYDKSNLYFSKYISTHKNYDPSLDDDSLILIYPDNYYDALNGMAANAEMSGDFQKAKKIYQEIYDYHKTAYNSAANLGRLILGENDIVRAKELFEEQLKAKPDENVATLGMSIVSILKKDEKSFSNYFHHAKKLNYSAAQFNLLFKSAKTYQSLNKISEAIELFEMAGKLKIDNNLLLELASAYMQTSQIKKASNVYEQLLELDPDNTDILNDIGNCYFQLEDYNNAKQYYIRVTEASSFKPIAYRNLGLTYARLADMSKAVESLTKYHELSPADQGATNLLADILMHEKKHSQALAYYEQLLKISPQNENALFGLSECYLNMGHRDSAIIGFEQILTLNPEHKLAQNRLRDMKMCNLKAN